jgi:hypothetical protein
MLRKIIDLITSLKLTIVCLTAGLRRQSGFHREI